MENNNSFTSSSVNAALQRVRNTLAYSLKENYGVTDDKVVDSMLKMHGLDKDRFDFINNFETLIEKGISDASVDTNANKSDISITGMFAETAMPINKLVGYRYLYRKLKDMYGKKRAKYLTGRMYDMSLALADSTNILKPYSYYGNTPIYVKINNEEYYLTLKQLFERYSKFSKYDEGNNMDVILVDDIKQDVLFHKSFMMNNENRGRWSAYTKSTKDLEKINENILCSENVEIKVWDDENGFVNVSRIVRHKNNKDMILYVTEDGDFAFVTEDHPIILEDGSEIFANNLAIGSAIKDAIVSNPIPSEFNKIHVPEKFAYFLGFMLGDGNLQGYDQDPNYIDSPVGCVKFLRGGNLVSVSQKDITESRIYKITKELFPDANFFKFQREDAINPMTGKPFNQNNMQINFTDWSLNLLCSYYFEYGRNDNSFTKKLPKNIFNWETGSIEAFIAGVLDADGTVTKSNGRCDIQMKSLATINGLYELLKLLGVETHKKLCGYSNDDFMFGVTFRPTEKIYEWSEKLWKIDHSIVFDKYSAKNDAKSRSNKIAKIVKIQTSNENVKFKKSFLYQELEYVYDITTDTGRFVANGMIQHNCYSVNASKLVYEGRPWGSLPSGMPHRVVSYINALCETVHQLSNHLAGAIAIGSFFLDIAHVMLYREHKTLTDLQDPEYRKYIENALQSFIHSMNMLSRNAVESPFSNISVFDRPKIKGILSADNMGWYFDKEDMVDGVPEAALKDCGEGDWLDYVVNVILDIQDIYCDVMDRGDLLHDGRPIEFPVCTVNISRKTNEDGTYSFEDPKFLDEFCKKHDAPRYNIYVSSGIKAASCCRLISDADLFELGGQVNSFGGTGLSLGSHRVLTINMRRIALECKDFEDYKRILGDRLNEAADVLVAHRALIKDLIDRGVQPFMSNGWIELDKMFSTFGIMGYYEAAQDLTKRFGEDDYLGKMVEFIDTRSRELSKERHNVFNVEEIPGESMSYKLANCDRWIYGEDKVPETLYANQFVPLWENATLFEKFHEEGRLAAKLTGGGIVHYSLGEKVTPEQTKYIIERAMAEGCEHFALNTVYSICENDHYSFGKLTVCPKCGGKITDALTRTVGFYTKVSDWATPKREGDFNRRNYKGINE